MSPVAALAPVDAPAPARTAPPPSPTDEFEFIEARVTSLLAAAEAEGRCVAETKEAPPVEVREALPASPAPKTAPEEFAGSVRARRRCHGCVVS